MSDQPEIAPCPYCKGECYVESESVFYGVECCHGCGYRAVSECRCEAEAIAAHNRIATAVPRDVLSEVLRAYYSALPERPGGRKVGGEAAACEYFALEFGISLESSDD
jgi:hypothetical protein